MGAVQRASDRPQGMAEAIAIERRFTGPPDSGQGGYTCGLVAEALGAECAAVSLRRPPPLETPLRLEQRDGAVALLDGDELVAEGAPADLRLSPPAPVGLDTA